MAERLSVTASVSIAMDEIEWRFSPSGGPGGQHANRAHTRAEAHFDIAGSPSLTDAQRSVLVARFGPDLRVAADDERSQVRNRELALERLRSRLASALQRPTPRRPTRPSRSASLRRLQDKRRRGRTKQTRRRLRPGDDL